MLSPEQKEDFSDKLTRYLANPSATQETYERYHQEHPDTTYEAYTQALEDLSERLNSDSFDDQDGFCQEVKQLQLPHNQFGCDK